MAEMIGGVLGAGASLAGAALSAQAQQTANIINWMNLQFQKENARKQHRLSTSARGDVYGNKQKYNEALNEWIIALTPTQEKITKAGEKEQLLTLTEDAQRNRAIREQQRARGVEAGKDYNRVLASYRYGGPKSELAIRDELTNLLAGVTQENAGQQKTELIRAAMREGRGPDTGQLLKVINDAAGKNMAANMLTARGQAAQEYSGRMAQHQSQHLPLMAELTKLMDMGGDAAIKQPGLAGDMSALQQQQFAGIQAALQNEASQVGSAYKGLAASSAKAPDLSGVAKALSGIGGGGGRSGRPKQQQVDPVYSVMQPQSNAYLDDDRFATSYNEEF